MAVAVAPKQPTTHKKPPPPPPSPLRLPLSPRSQIRSPPSPDARRIAAFGADKGEEEGDQTSAAEPEVRRLALGLGCL